VPGAKFPGANILDNPDVLDRSFASTAPTPMPQNPYLQSGRLVPPATGGGVGLNKTLLTKMDQILAELKIPTRPMPTKRVCDVYDSVRKDVLTLLTLQKMLMQKEGNLQAKRVKLSKMGIGEGRVLDEEALLGITPPPPPAPSAAATAAPKTTKATRPAKSKPAAATGGTKSKATTPKAKSDDAGKTDAKDAAGTKKPKTAPKRKRKPDAKIPAPVAPAPAGSVPAAGAVPSAVAPPSAKPATKPAATGQVVATVDPKQQGGKKRARKT
jgi:DNA methyltransferase 1-associated protein 1